MSIETKPSIEIVCKWKGCHRPAHIGRPVSTPLGIRTFCNDHVNAALKLDGCESFRNASPAGRSFSEEKEPKRLCSWKGCESRASQSWSHDTKYRVRGLPRGKQIPLCFNCLEHMHKWFTEQTREQSEANERRIHAQEAAEDNTTCHCRLCTPEKASEESRTVFVPGACIRCSAAKPDVAVERPNGEVVVYCDECAPDATAGLSDKSRVFRVSHVLVNPPDPTPWAKSQLTPAPKESPVKCSWTSFSTQTVDGIEKRIPAPCPSIASVTIKSKHGPLSVCKEHSSLVPAQTQEVA